MEPAYLTVFEIVRVSDLVFFAFATLAVVGAAGTALSTNIVYASFSLLAALFGMAALFAWLAADYLAITQLIVYVGGILVLFLFAVMLTSKIKEAQASNPVTNVAPAALVSVSLVALLGTVGVKTPWQVLPDPESAPRTATIGHALLGQYLLPFEIISVLILASLVGAVMMARKEIKE